MSITANYVVTGMTCGHCASHVSQEIKAIAGVTDVHVGIAGPMTIASDEAIDFALIEAAVAEAGDYTVVPA